MDNSVQLITQLPAGIRDIHSLPKVDHLAAKGSQPEPPAAPVLTDEWQLVEIDAQFAGSVGYSTEYSGLRRRLKDGREVWQAYCDLSDIPGHTGMLTEERYINYGADPVQVDAYEHINPARIQEQNIIAAAIVRNGMAANEASPRDMIPLLRNLLREKERRYHAWEDEQAKRMQQAKQDQDDIELARRVLRGMQLLEQLEGKK